MDNNCPNISAYVLPWAGKFMHACPDHARAMSALANAIGSPMQLMITTDLLPCEFNDDLGETYDAKQE